MGFKHRTCYTDNITNIHQLNKIGCVAAALVLHENDDVTFMSSTGNIVRLRGSVIPSLSRTARGVRLVRLEEEAVVAGVTANDADAIPADPDEQAETALPADQDGLPADDGAEEIEESDAEEEEAPEEEEADPDETPDEEA